MRFCNEVSMDLMKSFIYEIYLMTRICLYLEYNRSTVVSVIGAASVVLQLLAWSSCYKHNRKMMKRWFHLVLLALFILSSTKK